MSARISDEEYFIHFWSQIDRSGGPRACWEWQGGKRFDGYGTAVHFGLQGAHRIAWYYAHGAPGRKYVLHTCDNPSCCNPSHLYLGTHQDNMRDMVERGRQMWQPFSNAQAEKLGEDYAVLAIVAADTADGNWRKNGALTSLLRLRSREHVEFQWTRGNKALVRVTPKGLLSLAVLTATVYLERGAA